MEKIEIKHNVSLKKLNTFGIDVMAGNFTSFQTVASLQDVIETYRKQTLQYKSQLLVLGGGQQYPVYKRC